MMKKLLFTKLSIVFIFGAASDDAGTETIMFAANVFGTLNLGGSEIVIQNNDVNIVGYTGLIAETLIVSGSNTNRIFRIVNSDVSLTGLTFANDDGTGAVGSGFDALNMANATTSVNSDSDGGGFYFVRLLSLITHVLMKFNFKERLCQDF